MNEPAATATNRRDPIKTDLDQSNRLLPISSFSIHPSAFKTCLWFLAKNKNAAAKRGFLDRRQQILVNRSKPAFTNSSNN